MDKKIKVSAEHLKELARIAKQNGTEYAFIELALEWADQASAQILRLQEQVAALEERQRDA